MIRSMEMVEPVGKCFHKHKEIIFRKLSDFSVFLKGFSCVWVP